MIGKASEIKTWLVSSYSSSGRVVEDIDSVINRVLETLALRNAEIVNIQYQMSQNESIADTALIIYKEGGV